MFLDIAAINSLNITAHRDFDHFGVNFGHIRPSWNAFEDAFNWLADHHHISHFFLRTRDALSNAWAMATLIEADQNLWPTLTCQLFYFFSKIFKHSLILLRLPKRCAKTSICHPELVEGSLV